MKASHSAYCVSCEGIEHFTKIKNWIMSDFEENSYNSSLKACMWFSRYFTKMYLFFRYSNYYFSTSQRTQWMNSLTEGILYTFLFWPYLLSSSIVAHFTPTLIQALHHFMHTTLLPTKLSFLFVFILLKISPVLIATVFFHLCFLTTHLLSLMTTHLQFFNRNN